MTPISTYILSALPGYTELLVVLAIVIFLFGGSKLPQLGESLGKGIKNFRNSFQKNDDVPPQVVEAQVLPEEPLVDTPSSSSQKTEEIN